MTANRWFGQTMLALIALVAGPGPALATPILSVSPSSQSVLLGDSFSLDINIGGVTDLYGFNFDLSFGPTPLRLNAVSMTEGAFLPTGGTTAFFPGTIDNVAGQILAITDSLIAAIPEVSGSGRLARVNFMAVALGTADISISNILLLDSNLDLITFDAPRGGTVTVTAVPEPGSLLLLTSGAIGLLRRKKPTGPSGTEVG